MLTSALMVSVQDYLALTEQLLDLCEHEQWDLFSEIELLRNSVFEQIVKNNNDAPLSDEMRAIVEVALAKNGLLQQRLVSRHEELQNLLAQTRTQQKISATYR